MIYILMFGTSTIPWSMNTHFPIEKLEMALIEYKADCGRFPSELEGLKELLSSEKLCWNGPYVLKKMLLDRVAGNDYLYVVDNEHYEIISKGLDGIEGNEDDFRSSDNKSRRYEIYRMYQKRDDFRHNMLVSSIIFIIVMELILLEVLLKKLKLLFKLN